MGIFLLLSENGTFNAVKYNSVVSLILEAICNRSCKSWPYYWKWNKKNLSNYLSKWNEYISENDSTYPNDAQFKKISYNSFCQTRWKKGMIAIDQIRTVDKLRIIRVFENLTETEIAKCKEAIKETFID